MTAPTSKQALLACLNASNNDAGITFDDVDFGLPQVVAATPRNTRITVTAKPGSQYTGSEPYDFGRVALSALQPTDPESGDPVNVQVPESATTYGDLLGPINALNRTGLVTADDLANGSTALPALNDTPVDVTLTAHANSYGWIGSATFGLVRLVERIPLATAAPNQQLEGLNYELLTEYVVIEPFLEQNGELSRNLSTASETMLVGSGNPIDNLASASNNEIYLAGSARRYNDPVTIASVPGQPQIYNIEIDNTEDWNFPIVFALINRPADESITDLYDIKLKITAASTNEFIELTYSTVGNVPHLIDAANSIDIDDGYLSPAHRIFQEIQRLSFYDDSLGAIVKNTAGAPMGLYHFVATATRKSAWEGNTVDPVVLAFDVNVEAAGP